MAYPFPRSVADASCTAPLFLRLSEAWSALISPLSYVLCFLFTFEIFSRSQFPHESLLTRSQAVEILENIIKEGHSRSISDREMIAKFETLTSNVTNTTVPYGHGFAFYPNFTAFSFSQVKDTLKQVSSRKAYYFFEGIEKFSAFAVNFIAELCVFFTLTVQIAVAIILKTGSMIISAGTLNFFPGYRTESNIKKEA